MAQMTDKKKIDQNLVSFKSMIYVYYILRFIK